MIDGGSPQSIGLMPSQSFWQLKAAGGKVLPSIRPEEDFFIQSLPKDVFLNGLLAGLAAMLPPRLQVHVPLVTRLLRMLILSAAAHPAKDYVTALEHELAAYIVAKFEGLASSRRF